MEKGIKKTHSYHIWDGSAEQEDWKEMESEQDPCGDPGITYTENGGLTYSTTWSALLDLFAQIGALRDADEKRITDLFEQAYLVDPTLAMRIMFYGRDVREGLGERRVFRILLAYLAQTHPESAKKVIPYIAEYGRYDDLLALLHTPCEEQMIAYIQAQLAEDIAAMKNGESVSLLAKWLPSVNTSNRQTVKDAGYLAHQLGMKEKDYRKLLSSLRRKIAIIENSLRKRDYSFEYAKQPAKAMLKYRKAFLRNDETRYTEYLSAVAGGTQTMHTGTLYPYEIVKPIFRDISSMGYVDGLSLNEDECVALDTTWNALPDYTNEENALVVMDGSGSMYSVGNPQPIEVAASLAVYYAERNKGKFANCFITFSETPQLIRLKGDMLVEKIHHCVQYNDPENTNLSAVFDMLIEQANEHRVPPEEMPKKLYIISDMEFDECVEGADIGDFEYAKAIFARNGYVLPEIIFWNVQSRHGHIPVRMNDRGVALVSGCSANTFRLLQGDITDPLSVMMTIIGSGRYDVIEA